MRNIVAAIRPVEKPLQRVVNYDFQLLPIVV